MKPACPKCHATALYEEHGGLFSVRCSVCHWHLDGTVNRDLLPRIDPAPYLAARSDVPVSTAALKIVREVLVAAKNKSFDDIRNTLTTAPGMWVGNIPAHQIEDLRTLLSSVGIWLEAPAHEES